MKKQSIYLILTFIFINSCSYPEILFDKIVYENDFEEGNSEDIIDGYVTSEFNGTKVLGNFNNDGFTVHLDNIEDHDYVFVSFDLYIHGSWDGNFNGFKENDKADKWIIEVDPKMDLHKDPTTDKFVTTFSNSPCFSTYCLKQSFPENHPYDNYPTTGSSEINLPEICENNFFGGKTTLYKIEKVFPHRGNAVLMRFYDELYQPNAIDIYGTPQMKCDESWSIDNLKIRIVNY